MSGNEERKDDECEFVIVTLGREVVGNYYSEVTKEKRGHVHEVIMRIWTRTTFKGAMHACDDDEKPGKCDDK